MSSLFGERVRRVEDDRLVRGHGAYLDDLGHDALAAAFVRSPHAHARIIDIDVADALDVDGLVAIYTYEDLPGRVAEPLPLLIPHPALTHGRTPVPAGQRRGQPRRRGGRDGGRRATGTWPRTPPSGSWSSYEPLPAGGRRGRRARGRAPGARRRARQRRRAPGAASTATPRPRSPRRRTCSSSTWTIERSRVDAAGGPGRAGPLGRRVAAAADLDLDPDLDRACGPPSPPSSAWPLAERGRDHPGRGRRLRRQDRAPVAGGGARAVGGAAARPAGQVHRGPARALHRQRARARPAAPRHGSGSTTRAGCSGSTSGSGTTTAPTCRTG